MALVMRANHCAAELPHGATLISLGGGGEGRRQSTTLIL